MSNTTPLTKKENLRTHTIGFSEHTYHCVGYIYKKNIESIIMSLCSTSLRIMKKTLYLTNALTSRMYMPYTGGISFFRSPKLKNFEDFE